MTSSAYADDGRPSDFTRQLQEAAWAGDIERVKELASHGADLEAYNENGNTPLHLAIENAGCEVVRTLLELGADVNRRTRDGFWTPLIHAVEVESDAAIQLQKPADNRVIQLLLEYGASVKQRATNGVDVCE
jgi:ankyrin repeat protein